MSFAVNKYLLKARLPLNLSIILIGGYSLHKLTHYGIVCDKDREYRRIYETYQKEVQDEKFRGLKLFKGRHVSKVVEKEFTTSNLDDFKRLMGNQR